MSTEINFGAGYLHKFEILKKDVSGLMGKDAWKCIFTVEHNYEKLRYETCPFFFLYNIHILYTYIQFIHL